MTTTARKWGNGIGVRIPEKLAVKFGVNDGTKIEIEETVDGVVLILTTKRKKPSLEELVAKCTLENHHEEVDFGGPIGRELI